MKTVRPKERESDIQKTIMEGLAAMHIFAFRLNTAAIKTGNRFFRAHSLGPGAADILAVTEGDCDECLGFRPVWIEVKTASGGQSVEQMAFQKHVESLYHRYVLARSWEDVLAVVK